MKRINHLIMGSVLLFGCSARGGDEEDRENAPWQADVDRPARKVELEALTLTDKCTGTWGESCDACEAEQEARAQDCWDTCTSLAISTGSLACVDTCGRVQSSEYCASDCSEPEDACIERGYKFAPLLDPNNALLKACEAALKRDKTCDEESTGPDCELYSRVERPEAVDVYRCVSEAECGTDVEPCFASLPTRSFAAHVQALCPDEKLEEDALVLLEDEGDWARDEVARDIDACASYCGFTGFDDCVNAWIQGVTGWSVD